MKLCDNCLTDKEVRKCPVGPEQGNQKDPYTAELDLCVPCLQILCAGNLHDFAARNQRPPHAGPKPPVYRRGDAAANTPSQLGEAGH